MTFKSNPRIPKLITIIIIFIFFNPARSFSEDSETLKEKKAKEGYTLNLKELVNRTKKKIAKVDAKLEDEDRYKRNQEREEKAKEYYEKANEFYKEGKFDKAKEYWEKAIKITEHAEMKGYVRHSVTRQKQKDKALAKEEQQRIKRLEQERGYSAKEVEKKYDSAVRKYKHGDYLAAKDDFEAVDNMFPDHKATKSYLALINFLIDKDQQAIIEAKLKDSKPTDSKAKAVWKRDLERREEERSGKLETQAEALYSEALKLYKAKNYEGARAKFKEVEWVLPDYKKTLNYLSRIDSDIEKDGVKFSDAEKVKFFKEQVKKEKSEEARPAKQPSQDQRLKERESRRKEEAEFVYQTALNLYKKNYYEQALDKFNEVQEIYPSYRKTEDFIQKLHKKLSESEAKLAKTQPKMESEKIELPLTPPEAQEDMNIPADSEEQKALLANAEEKYQEAIVFYNGRNFIEAQRKFIAVEATYPGYKATREYLDYIDQEMAGIKKSGQPSFKTVKGGQSAKQNQALAKPAAVKKDDVEEKYELARKFYDAENFELAKESFLEVQSRRPGFKATAKYLEKIDGRLVHEMKEREKYQRKEVVKEEKVEKPSMLSKIFSSKQGNKEIMPQKRIKTQPAHPSVLKKEYKDVIAMPDQKKQYTPMSEKEYKAAIGKINQEEEEQRKIAQLDRMQRLKQEELVSQKEIGLGPQEEEPKLKTVMKKEAKVKVEKEKVSKVTKIREQKVAEKKPKEKKIKAKVEKEENKIAKEQKVAEKKPKEKKIKAKVEKEENKIAKEIKKEEAVTAPAVEITDIQREIPVITKEDKRNFKENRAELNSMKRTLKREKQDNLDSFIDELYDEAFGLYRNDQLLEAKANLITVQQVKPGYRLTPTLIHRIDKRIKSQPYLSKLTKEQLQKVKARQDRNEKRLAEEKNKAEEDKLERMVEGLYSEGVQLFEAKEYAAAQNKFAAVEQFKPGYRRSAAYIKRVKEEMSVSAAAVSAVKTSVNKESIPGNAPKSEMAEVKQSPGESNTVPKKTYQPMSDAEYQRQMRQTEDQEEALRRLAKKDRIEQMESEDVQQQLSPFTDSTTVTDQELNRLNKERLQKIAAAPVEAQKKAPDVGSEKEKSLAQRLREEKLAEKQKDAQRRKELKQIDKDLKSLHDELVRSYREDGQSQELKDRLEMLLAKGGFSDEEKIKMRNAFNKDLGVKKSTEKQKETANKKKELKQVAKDLKNVREEIVRNYREDRADQAKELMNRFEMLLAKGEFSDEEKIKMRNELNKDVYKAQEKFRKKWREETEQAFEKENQEKQIQEKQDVLAHDEKDNQTVKKTAPLNKALDKAQSTKKNELAAMEKRIQQEEEQLAKEKEQEQLKSQKLEQRQKTKRSEKAPDVSSVRMAKSKNEYQRLEIEKKKELERLVKARQLELKKKREEIQKQFEKSIADLYKKAVRLFKKKENEQAAMIFAEIQRMMPGYKETESYLKKIGFYAGYAPEAKRKEFVRPRTSSAPKNRVKAVAQALDEFQQKVLW